MKSRRNLYGIHNDFSGVGGGLRRGCILIRNRDGMWWHVLHLNTWAMLRNTWGGMWWDVLHLNTRSMLRNMWGGLGWDVMTCGSGALEHMVDAMQHVGWGGVGCDDTCCTWTHGRCYATCGVGWGGVWWRVSHLNTWAMLRNTGWDVMTGVSLEHMVHATPHVGCGGVGCDDMCCTWTHGRCYATRGVGRGGQRKSECRLVWLLVQLALAVLTYSSWLERKRVHDETWTLGWQQIKSFAKAARISPPCRMS